jgi:hypothetical protein
MANAFTSLCDWGSSAAAKISVDPKITEAVKTDVIRLNSLLISQPRDEISLINQGKDKSVSNTTGEQPH